MLPHIWCFSPDFLGSLILRFFNTSGRMSSCQVACKRRDWKRINICHFPENHRQMYQVFHTFARLKHDFKESLPYEEGPFDISWLPAACLEVRGPPQRLRCAFGSAGSAQGAAGGSWGAAAFPGAEQQESAGMLVHVSSRSGLGLHCCFEEKKGRWCLLGRWSWNWEIFPERIGFECHLVFCSWNMVGLARANFSRTGK